VQAASRNYEVQYRILTRDGKQKWVRDRGCGLPDDDGEEAESDAMSRRIWWIDGYISTNDDLTWTLPGTNQ
jgi:hypothetical protein